MSGFSVDGQIPLALSLPELPGFDQFVVGDNLKVVQILGSICKGSKHACIYLWGPAGCGISHLLQATCLQADNYGRKVSYLPLCVHTDLKPEILENYDNMDIVCIDDVELIAGKPEWEQALLHLYNRIRDAGKNMIFGSHVNPQVISVNLQDLKSRLSWDLVFHIELLGDMDKIEVLKRRANMRGFKLPHEVAEYIVRHANRELPSLLTMLDVLEKATLTRQKKLTIPFVKSVLFEVES